MIIINSAIKYFVFIITQRNVSL